MGKSPKARVVPFSSVVGSSVTLHAPETGRVIGQLGIMNVGGDTRDDWKQRNIAVADDTALRINAHDDLVAALRNAQQVLAILIDPDSQHVSSLQVFAQATAAEAKARAALIEAGAP